MKQNNIRSTTTRKQKRVIPSKANVWYSYDELVLLDSCCHFCISLSLGGLTCNVKTLHAWSAVCLFQGFFDLLLSGDAEVVVKFPEKVCTCYITLNRLLQIKIYYNTNVIVYISRRLFTAEPCKLQLFKRK